MGVDVMKTALLRFCVAVCVLGLVMGVALPHANAADLTIEVAPNVLNLASVGSWVTVHTNIAYGAVVEASVILNGVPISWSKADNRGQFVAKFVIDEVRKVVGDVGPGKTEDVTLTLELTTIAGDVLVASDNVAVINVTEKKGR